MFTIKLDKVKEVLNDPIQIIPKLGQRGLLNWMSDKKYLELVYYSYSKKKLNLKKPKSYNEKLQWLKLFNRDPLYTILVDKYEVRQYVKEKIGESYLIPLLGIWNSPEEIQWKTLPKQFVLKPTHDSGSLIICEEKHKLNIKQTEKKLKKSLMRNYYYISREWPYKNVKPRIIAEKYMATESGETIKDYRFFCFNGVPKFITVDIDITNKENTRRNIYDLNWNLMDVEISYPNEKSYNIRKPKRFDEMIDLVSKLSKNIPHVRVDLYSIDEKIYFGEMTFYHQGGIGAIKPDAFNQKMGEWIELPSKSKV